MVNEIDLLREELEITAKIHVEAITKIQDCLGLEVEDMDNNLSEADEICRHIKTLFTCHGECAENKQENIKLRTELAACRKRLREADAVIAALSGCQMADDYLDKYKEQK